MNEEDEKALEMFMSNAAPVKRTLADIIAEKITEKQTEIHTQMSGGYILCNTSQTHPGGHYHGKNNGKTDGDTHTDVRWVYIV